MGTTLCIKKEKRKVSENKNQILAKRFGGYFTQVWKTYVRKFQDISLCHFQFQEDDTTLKIQLLGPRKKLVKKQCVTNMRKAS